MKGQVFWAIGLFAVFLVSAVSAVGGQMGDQDKCFEECSDAAKNKNEKDIPLVCLEWGGKPEIFSACQWPCIQKHGQKNIGISSIAFTMI